MPFQTDDRLARDVRKTFGEYITTFSSKGGQVRADLFRTGRVVVAHVSFPTGLDAQRHRSLCERAVELRSRAGNRGQLQGDSVLMPSGD
jgi:hypothetical protein